MNVKSSIGKRIAEGRIALGLSQLQLSELTGFGKTRISNWETGFRTPKLEESKVLEKHLQLPAPYLLCLSDNKEFPLNFGKKSQTFKFIPLYTESELLQVTTPLHLHQIPSKHSLPLMHTNEVLAEQGGFAFELYDNSMFPEFKQGDIIVLKPTEKIRHNDIVLVKINQSGDILLRNYFLDGATNPMNPLIKLIPNNNQWLTLSTQHQEDWQILGVLSNLQRLFT